VAGALGRYHYNVYIFRRNYLAETNIEPVRECKGRSAFNIWFYFILPYF